MDWFEARQDETQSVRVAALPDPGKNRVWSQEPKYASINQIMKLYRKQSGVVESVPADEFAEVDFAGFLGEWDPNEPVEPDEWEHSPEPNIPWSD